MALTQIAATASSSGGSATPQPDKQIAALSTSNNAVLYTVPDGRKFVGYAGHERTYNGQGYHAILVAPDGTEVMHTGGFSSFTSQYYPQGSTTVELTLMAGASIKNGGGANNCVVWGIESDA